MEVACFAAKISRITVTAALVAEYLKDHWGNVEIEHIL